MCILYKRCGRKYVNAEKHPVNIILLRKSDVDASMIGVLLIAGNLHTQ